jgi:hypothetical protein
MRKIIALFVACMLFPVWPLLAEKPREGVSYIFNFYDDNARNMVIAPLVSLSKKISEHYYLGAKLGVDAITSATKQSQTTAGTGSDEDGDESGLENMHMRYAPSLSLTYDKDDTAVTAGGYYSTESTYIGRSLFAAYTRSLNQNNTVLGIRLNQSFDYWKPDRQLPDNTRQERTLDLSATQLLSSKSSIQFTYSSLKSTGFIALPTESLVTAATITIYAQYPETRKGNAYAVRFVTLLSEPTSFHLDYRYYRDDWHIQSDTLNFELYRDISASLVLGARYRYYTQEQAFFAKDLAAYTPGDKLIAVDYRMYAFRTNTIGLMALLKPSWNNRLLSDADKVKVKLSADYYATSKQKNIQYVYNTDHLSGFFTTIALDYDF